jgi:hypothetical protein
MSRIFTTLFVFVLLAAMPIATFADSQTFTPPARKGSIYIIVRHKKSFPPMKTGISIRWGSWSKSGKFDAAGWRYSREGFVIKLNHAKADSVQLSVNTDGYIVNIYQGDPPSQKSDKLWEYVEW